MKFEAACWPQTWEGHEGPRAGARAKCWDRARIYLGVYVYVFVGKKC